MAPVFSRAAWRCVWHLIQNDLIHGWGLDMKLGYCAQGDRAEKVGVIDSEYVVHQGIPSLGGPSLSSKVCLSSQIGTFESKMMHLFLTFVQHMIMSYIPNIMVHFDVASYIFIFLIVIFISKTTKMLSWT
jgi:hypothetical protein